MRTAKRTRVKIAYRIDEHRMKRIEKILLEANPELEYSIQCVDDSLIRFSSLSELFEYSNPKSREIKRISIETSWDSQNVRIEVNFSSNSYSPIDFTVRGEDRDVIYYSHKIEEEVRSFQMWYSKIRFIDMSLMYIVSMVLSFFGMLAYSAIFGFQKNTSSTSSDWSSILTYLIMLGLFLFSMLIEWIKNRSFQVAIFEVGEGIARNKFKEKVRNFVVVTIAIPIVLGVIVNYIS
ncbi:hypothetical protein [Paenibacillus apiarius]|uniref:hypothetical protein n=1 Tax=Paenibacillus apiarius TaxID=46240 RepID=UPI003B3B1980